MTYQIGYEIEAYGLNARAIREVIESKGSKFLTPGSDRLYDYLESKRVPTRCKKMNPTYEHNQSWIAAHDGSLTATNLGPSFEVISPVMYGEAGMREAKRIHKALVKRGAVTHRTAGNHIHMGINHSARWKRMSDKKKAEVGRRLAHVYHFYQPVIDSLLSNVRCSGVDGRSGSGYGPSTTPINLDRPFGGRCVLNLGSWVLQGRVEFRQVGNTLKWENIEGMTAIFKAMLNVCFNENHVSWRRRFEDFTALMRTETKTWDSMVQFLALGSKTVAWGEARIIHLRDRYEVNRDMRNRVLRVDFSRHARNRDLTYHAHPFEVSLEEFEAAAIRRFGETANRMIRLSGGRVA